MQLCFVPLIIGAAAIFPLNGVQWSLLCELGANLAHAVGLRRIGNKELSFLVLLLALLLIIVAMRHGSLAVGHDGLNWKAGFLRVAFPYAMGLLLYRLWAKRSVVCTTDWKIAAIALPAALLIGGLPGL